VSDKKAKKMDAVGHVQSLLMVSLLYHECEVCFFTYCVLVQCITICTEVKVLHHKKLQQVSRCLCVISLNWPPLKI